MRKNFGTLLLCGLTAALGLGSCISTSDELDLDKKKLSLDMRIAPGGLKIPVGSLGKIYIDSLIKINDDSALDTLDDGLYGITMDGTIKKVEVEIDNVTIDIPNVKDTFQVDFSNPGVETFQVPVKSISANLGIQSINLDDINSKLPAFESSFKSKEMTGLSIPAILIGQNIPKSISIPVKPDTFPKVHFTYEFPSDLKSIDTVSLGQPGVGQKVDLSVDLTGIFNFLDDPQIVIQALDITFPKNFRLAKDNAIFDYVGDNSVSITGKEGGDSNNFNISYSLLNNVALANNANKLPISFYVKDIDFSGSTKDLGNDKKGISFYDSIQYQFELGIMSGTIKQGGNLSVQVDMASKLGLADFSVTTNEKQVDLETKTLPLSFQIDDLDNISQVNKIIFDSENNKINLKLKQFSFDPFSFSPTSVITLTFPQDLVFDKTQNAIYSQGVEVGNWSSTGNDIQIYPGLANGNDIDFDVQLDTFIVNKQVENNSIKIENEISYSAAITVAESSGINMASLTKLANKQVELSTGGSLTVESASVVTGVIDTDIDESTTISIDEEVDKALKSVERIDFKNESQMVMNLKFEGIPSTIEHVDISELSIAFPDFLSVCYKGQDNAISVKDNKLIIKDKPISQDELKSDGDGFTVNNVYVTGIEFDKPLVTKNGRLILDNESVVIKGNVKVDNQSVSSGEMKDIKILPTVSFDQIEVKSIVGKVDPEIDPTHEDVELSLGSDIDFLKNEGNKLTLSDPEIRISLTSTVTVPINLKLTLSSTDSDKNPIAEGIAPDDNDGIILLPACPVDEDNRVTTIIIYKDAMPSTDLPNPIYVRMSKLSDLMTTIPDKIQFDLTAQADTANASLVDLTRELTVEGKYDVQVPLSFNDLYMEYNDTIKNLGDNLKDVADKIESAEIYIDAKALSTIPLGVTLTAVPLDYKNREIRDISIEKCLIKAGSKEGTEVDVHIAVDLKKKGALEKLEAIAFKAVCESAEGKKSSIQKGQNVYLHDIVLDMPSGINVDFTDKKDE